MARSAPPLLAIFRSPLQARILAAVYLRESDRGVSISELARELEAAPSSVHHEVKRLIDGGLLSENRVGRARLLLKPDDELTTRPLTELLAVTFGPLPVLLDLLDRVSGIDEAYIFGSWAARYAGLPGPVPNDVDVLVIGDTDPDELDDVALAAQERLHRPVDIVVRRSLSRERGGGDAFWQTLQQRPLVTLVGDHPRVILPEGAEG